MPLPISFKGTPNIATIELYVMSGFNLFSKSEYFNPCLVESISVTHEQKTTRKNDNK
jgi:hypothetical protein